MNPSGTLHLFTRNFPYGAGESFLENEIPYLCEAFEKVEIYPLFSQGQLRELPANSRVNILLENAFATASSMQILGNIRTFSAVLRSELSRTPKALHGQRRSELRQALYRANKVGEVMRVLDPNDQVYSYWSNDWATVLSLLVKKEKINGFTSRVHGFDLYEERHPEGGIAFRPLHLECAQKIVAVSKAGLDYLNAKYPAYKAKFHLSHLGVHDHGEGPTPMEETPHIVSCSNIIPIKRVELLADALEAFNKPIRWTHFGGGKGLAQLQDRVSRFPAQLKADLKGPTPNAEVLRFYKEHPVNAFIHLSSTEGGVSVAMQEAASFGIPLLGCNVGGVPEICTPDTGILLGADPTMNEVVDGLQKLLQLTAVHRSIVRSFWKERFDAASVFPLFCRLLRS